MEFHPVIWIALALWLAASAWYAYRLWRRKGLRWIPPYLFTRSRRRPVSPDEEIHVLLCVTDHYEPKFGAASTDEGRGRVEHWVTEYPRQFARFRDSDGRTPRHSFFFPVEEYEPEYLDALAGLCRAGFGEVEVHLHHNNDSADNLRSTLAAFRDLLDRRHGLLCRDRSGALRYGFIHGNWGLCNSRPRRDWCGVNNEIDILLDTGCYADFTFPSAPDGTQPALTNRIYYAVDRPGQPCSHWRGWDIGAPRVPDKALLLIQGPLLLDWRRRKFGLLPRLENACLQTSQPPSLLRLDYWLRARIHVPARPDWLFVKLHAHGAPESMHDVMLGPPMVRFHEELAQRAAAQPRFHYHYVSAREMYNLAKAAEAGFRGTVAEALDFLLVSNISNRKTAASERAPEPATHAPGG
ncbi:MAG: hypothetical protein U0793_13220 [Gemmataceae bacterium]